MKMPFEWMIEIKFGIDRRLMAYTCDPFITMKTYAK